MDIWNLELFRLYMASWILGSKSYLASCLSCSCYIIHLLKVYCSRFNRGSSPCRWNLQNISLSNFHVHSSIFQRLGRCYYTSRMEWGIGNRVLVCRDRYICSKPSKAYVYFKYSMDRWFLLMATIWDIRDSVINKQQVQKQIQLGMLDKMVQQGNAIAIIGTLQLNSFPLIDDSHGNTVELLIEARQGYDHAFLVCDKNGNDWLMADPAGYKAIDADYFAIAD